MTATASYGTVSAHEAYTLDQLAAIFNRDRDWVRNTFIRPIDHHSKKRLLDAEGQPIPGVFHFRQGGNYIISGQSLLAWIMEHGDRVIE